MTDQVMHELDVRGPSVTRRCYGCGRAIYLATHGGWGMSSCAAGMCIACRRHALIILSNAAAHRLRLKDVSEMPMRAALNATDTAYYLSLTEGEILELVQRGQIPYKMLRDPLLFLIHDLDEWLNALPGVPVWEALARMHEAAQTPPPVKTIAHKHRRAS
jgi:hypothetical protein